MKKTVWAILFGLFFGVLLCLNSKTIISASATNDLVVKITPVCTASEAASYSGGGVNIQQGDYRVTVSVENNSIGFGTIVMRLYYNNSYFVPVGTGFSNELYEWVSPDTYSSVMATLGYNTAEHLVGLSFSKQSTIWGDGDLVNFFLRPTGTMPTFAHILTGLEILSIKNTNNVSIMSQFNYDTSHYQRGYRFLIGEIDGDGVITASDADYLEDVIDNYAISPQAPRTQTLYSTI